ncbi:MAG: exodeoxyribonuclease VII small subunit [Verrucomicrobiales bacterium]
MDPETPTCQTPADSDLPFEQAIERIEELVARMEGERLPLDDLIKAYDEGIRLLEVCRQRLDDAQRRIDLISQRPDGTVSLTPFSPDDAPTADEGSVRSRQRN